jgi:ATP-dependent DNA helicase RecG
LKQLSIPFPRHYALLSPSEIYEAVDEKLLRKLAEDRRIERKSPRIHGKDLGEYFSMWANTVPDGGLIVIGMDNDGQFSGCHDIGSDHLNKLEKAWYTYCPDARVESKRVGVTGKDGSDSFVVLFKTGYREDKVVRTASGQAFIRRADEKHELGNEEIREIEIDKRQVDIEKELVPLTFPDDFDAELIRRFVDGVKKVHQPLAAYQDIEVLQQRRLGKIDSGIFKPNTACAIAFAHDPVQLFPGCQIKFLRVDGEVELSGTNYNVIKTVPIEGPVPRLLEEATRVIESQLRDFSRLGRDGIFYTAPEYPREAWYEALVNACVHRSYGLKNMNIFVKMFDDKLVIESPGGFPPLVTPENIYNSHHPRNPTLMHAMFYMGLVKEHAEGTKRMRDTMWEMNLPEPKFSQVQSGIGFSQVVVTLHNHIQHRKVWIDTDVTLALGEALAKNLTVEEKRVLNFIAEHGKINASQCHRLFGLAKWHSGKRVLQKMTDKGLLKHVHSKTVLRDNKAHYVLPDAFKGLTKNERTSGDGEKQQRK